MSSVGSNSVSAEAAGEAEDAGFDSAGDCVVSEAGLVSCSGSLVKPMVAVKLTVMASAILIRVFNGFWGRRRSVLVLLLFLLLLRITCHPEAQVVSAIVAVIPERKA